MQKVIDAISVRVKKDAREQIVYINQIYPLLQEDSSVKECQTWSPPLFTRTNSTGDEGSLLMMTVLMYKMPLLPQGPHAVDMSFAQWTFMVIRVRTFISW